MLFGFGSFFSLQLKDKSDVLISKKNMPADFISIPNRIYLLNKYKNVKGNCRCVTQTQVRGNP